MERQQRPPRRAASGRDHRNYTQHPRQSQGKKGGTGFILKTLVLIVLCTGVIFTGIFAVYVATCVIPNAHVDVSEISMDQSLSLIHILMPRPPDLCPRVRSHPLPGAAAPPWRW